jgi:dUTP pyrophosphatase
MKIGFKRVHPDAKLPTYAHEGDAGMDVYAVEDTTLYPNAPTLVKTGLIAEIPMGYEIQVRPRSGLALKQGITVWNSPGTVDAGYRNEIGIILLWAPRLAISNSILSYGDVFAVDEEKVSVTIHKGDRIAQLVVAPVTKCTPVEVAEVGDTDRGTGGFGSTGV